VKKGLTKPTQTNPKKKAKKAKKKKTKPTLLPTKNYNNIFLIRSFFKKNLPGLTKRCLLD
jgi:hypothetical protein